MSGAIRLSRLVDPYRGEVVEPRDLRTSRASRADDCVLQRSGHHSHWIPMQRATKDKAGRWGTALVVRDSSVEVALDDGETVRLFHHDLAGQGDLWLAFPRLFWQHAWGWAWAGDRGVSVVTRGQWRRCVPAPPSSRRPMYLFGPLSRPGEGAHSDGGGA